MVSSIIVGLDVESNYLMAQQVCCSGEWNIPMHLNGLLNNGVVCCTK